MFNCDSHINYIFRDNKSHEQYRNNNDRNVFAWVILPYKRERIKRCCAYRDKPLNR